MEQQIRFCTTSDGVRIAYATTGAGPPIVRVLGWFTHLEMESENPEWRAYIETLSANNLLVRYDGRNMGLSDRGVSDLTVDGKVRDLEAVVDALKLRRFALYGTSEGGPTAITYAVRHPERMSRLILFGSFAGGQAPTPEEEERARAMVTLVRQGWGQNNPAFRQMFTSLFIPEADAEQVRLFNELQRVSATPEDAAAFLEAVTRINVRNLLPQVRVPTLVSHCRGDNIVPFEGGRRLAAEIPGARFLPLDGNNHFPLKGEPAHAQLFLAIDEFMAEDRKPARPRRRKAATSSAPLTILFTDITSSTPLTQRLGDAKAQELVRAHNQIVRDALKASGGSEIKHTGDGIMASFASASRALECAVAIQRAVEQSAVGGQPSADGLRVHVGLNAGEPVAEEDDLFGTAVQLARRVCDQAEGGEILASDVVRQLVAGKGFLFADRGDVALRGFEDPVRIYEVRWRDSA